MHYYQEINVQDDWILSCDGVRVKFELDPKDAPDIAQELFNNIYRVDIENFPPSFKLNNYKFLSKINYDNECSMSVGYCFNGCRKIDDMGHDENYLGFMDFNLNKVAHFDQFWLDYGRIKSASKYFEVIRVDIALDVPYEREFVFLQKDQRVYSSKVYSRKNRTEYLGLRNKVGRVKIYNKAVEQNLDYPLTRIEITCELNANSYVDSFPKVYGLKYNEQMNMDYMALNDTDKTILAMENELIVNGLDDGLTLFNMMSHQKKQKLKPFLLPESALLGRVEFNLVYEYFVKLRGILRV